MLEYLRQQLETILEAITQLRMTDENRLRLYEVAIKHLGTDASPRDEAPDRLACAETVNELICKAYGSYLYDGNRLSTHYLYKALRNSPLYKEVAIPAPGDIIISPTGFGKNLNMPNGHTGIVMLNGKIASNDSRTGRFEENYTIETWRERYERTGGYIVKLYRRI